jgi:hypothetical protein
VINESTIAFKLGDLRVVLRASRIRYSVVVAVFDHDHLVPPGADPWFHFSLLIKADYEVVVEGMTFLRYNSAVLDWNRGPRLQLIIGCSDYIIQTLSIPSMHSMRLFRDLPADRILKIAQRCIGRSDRSVCRMLESTVPVPMSFGCFSKWFWTKQDELRGSGNCLQFVLALQLYLTDQLEQFTKSSQDYEIQAPLPPHSEDSP